MREKYTTVQNLATAEIIEKKSRFISTVKPVSAEEEALELLNSLRRKYWDASHNVYAYILENNNIQRYSDDGEPAGTAGVPVLDFLKKEGLSDVIVVVTRYFGGTLLGTGGLVHAYSKSAKAGIDAARKLDMILCKKINIGCEYTMLGKVQNELSKWDLIMEDIIYTEVVEITVYLPVSAAEQFEKTIIDKTNNKVTITVCEEGFKSRANIERP